MEDLISLRGRRSMVTGAASGIGRAIALRFAEAGSDLILVDVDGERLSKVEDEVRAFEVGVESKVVDLSRREEIDALWSSLSGREPDVLVNNAGIYPFRDFLQVDEPFLRKVMDVNLTSVFWMCQRMISARGKRGGVIVNVGSIEALLPFKEELAHYTVSKAGVIALTRALARDYGGRGFRVNAIVPGGIITPGTKEAAKKLGLRALSLGREYQRRVPMGRLGDPDEVARVALFLASDLSSYVNGALVAVDGGFLSA